MKNISEKTVKTKKQTGVAVPLGAIRTENSPVIGEYTSLPKFGEFCKQAGLEVIQLLPVLDSGTQSSPYSSLSAFALHPIYINISQIPGFNSCIEKNVDFRNEYKNFLRHKYDQRYDYEYILNAKENLIKKIWLTIVNSANLFDDKDKDYLKIHEQMFLKFISETKWIPSYCVFKNLKYKYMQESSKKWPKSDRNLSSEEILRRWSEESFKEKHYFYAFEQFVAYDQFKKASQKLKEMGITLKGDIPILLNDDSCDVWANPEIFNQKLRAGSPPDGDNPTGQNWGFPVYDWNEQEKNGYEWWKLRLKESEKFFGAYRLDHIPGFFRLWAMHDGESTAEFGAVTPNSTITATALKKNNFTKERIKWLSEPHIPTEEIFRKTGDLDKSHKILSLLCERIGREELWNFKHSVKSSSDIMSVSLENYELDEEIQDEIQEIFLKWWKNRALIEIKKDNFVPFLRYGESCAWNSLSSEEKENLTELFTAANRKQEKIWQNQAEKIFNAIIPETEMVPCGEDLGVNIECMPKVMEKFGILGLKVIRWCRDWFTENQPYENLKKYRKLSLVTTSVHDSSTLRQWWNTEKQSSREFEKAFLLPKKNKENEAEIEPTLYQSEFTAQIAEKVLEASSKTNGVWFIPPLQDWLYLEKKYFLADETSERVNIPGTVTKFNWTYRMPVSVEKLRENSSFIAKIQKISTTHNGTK